MIKGFSTGALAKNDFRQAIKLLDESSANAIELSALREDEVEDLVNAIEDLDLSKFEYISFHAPSKLAYISETELINILQPIMQKGWPIIIHPDIISNYNRWAQLSNCLCIENMDKRKRQEEQRLILMKFSINYLRLPFVSTLRMQGRLIQP